MLDKQKQKIFVDAIRNGCTYKAAASATGICEKTIYNWLRKGREATRKNCRYKQFLQAVKKAELERQQHLLQRIIEATDKDWKAGAWLLERRYGYRKDAVFDIPEEEKVADLPRDPLQLMKQQAIDLQGAMKQAMQAQSWQAYSALQRQYISVIDNIRAIEAEQGANDSLENASNDQLRNEAVQAIITLPPVLRQEIISELAKYNNVIPFKNK